MTSFPSTIPSPLAKGFSESVSKPIYSTESESGYKQTRPKGFLPHRKWEMSWNMMSNLDYAALYTFFINNNGLIFEWTNPLDGVTYNVRFAQEELSRSMQTNTHGAVNITLEEV